MSQRDSRPDTDRILDEVNSLEPFPQVALRVLQLSTEEDVRPRDLMRVVETDPGITAKVLKLCNSAHYGFRREVGSLEEAGNMLGVRTVVDLVMTSSASRYFRNYGASDTNSAAALWKRSVTNAWAAQLLAEVGGGIDRNRAYTLGLLQDIGHVVAERFIRERWVEICERVDNGLDLLAAETHSLGMAHTEIGARLADRWGLPVALVDSIRHHHTPELATVEPDLAWYAHLADLVTSNFLESEEESGKADATAEASREPDPHYSLDESAWSSTGVDALSLGSIEERLRTSLAGAQEFVEM